MVAVDGSVPWLRDDVDPQGSRTRPLVLFPPAPPPSPPDSKCKVNYEACCLHEIKQLQSYKFSSNTN